MNDDPPHASFVAAMPRRAYSAHVERLKRRRRRGLGSPIRVRMQSVLDIDAALSTIAQIGVTIPGFAAVITSLRREPAGLTPAEHVGFVLMLALASIAVVGALLPFVLDNFLSDDDVWRVCSMCLFVALGTALWYGVTQARTRRGTDSGPRHPRLFWWTGVLPFSMLAIVQPLALWRPAPDLYLTGLVAAIAGAGFQLWMMILMAPEPQHTEPASGSTRAEKGALLAEGRIRDTGQPGAVSPSLDASAGNCLHDDDPVQAHGEQLPEGRT